MFKFVANYFKQNRFKFVCYLFCILITGIISTYTPLLLSNLINSVIYTKSQKIFIDLCLLFFSLLIVNLLFSCFETKIFYELQIKIVGRICSDVISHLHKVSFSLLKEHDFVALTQKLNNDAVNVVSFMLNNIGSVLLHIAELIIIVSVLCNISVLIAILVLINGILYLIVYNKSKDTLFKKQFENKEAQSKYFSKLFEQFDFLKYIKVHILFDFFKKRLDNELTVLYKRTNNLINYQNFLSLIQGFSDTIIQILCYICAGYKILQGDMLAGNFVLVSSYISMAKQAILYFGNLGQQYQSQKVSYIRIQDLIKLPEEKLGCKRISSVFSITIQNLKFSFNNDIIINNLSCKLILGKIYGIKGVNGAGKSTLMDIIMGLYLNEYDGKIFFNDIELSEIDVYYLRQNLIEIAEQNPVLLEDNLSINLGLNNSSDKRRVTEYLSNFNFPYVLGKNGDLLLNNKISQLSGGEKQKIGIIRVLLKNTSIMIFDEPTSALDSKGSEYFKQILEEIKHNKIIILVSHDESLLEICDSIIPLSREVMMK